MSIGIITVECLPLVTTVRVFFSLETLLVISPELLFSQYAKASQAAFAFFET